MKAALLRSYGDVDQFAIEDIPTPSPGPGEVLLKIEAAAVNPFDLIVRQGFMAQYLPLELPAVLGGDAAGTIVALGEGVSGVSVGDRVIADFALNGRGSYAEFGVLPATSVAKLSDNLTFEQGAALPKAGLTGRQCVEALGVAAGDRVLISGGLGMVGRAAIQYLREIGARPVAGVRPQRLEEARELAGEALDITIVPVEATFDFAISTAAPVIDNVIANVRSGGKVASIVPVPETANADGRVVVLDVYHRTDAETMAAVVKAASEGALVIPIAEVFPLDEIGAAQTASASAPGKIVLKP